MRNLKIKQRLFLILFIEAVLISLLGWSGLQISFKIYDSQIYMETSDKLKLMSRAMDEKLRKIDELSYSLLADPELQQVLKTIKQYPGTYESMLASRNLQEKFLVRTPLQPFVTAVGIIDSYDHQVSAGQNPGNLDDDKIKQVKELASKSNGVSVWGKLEMDSSILYLMREVKESAFVSMETLGYIMIGVDADKLVHSTTSEMSAYDTHLMILSEDAVVYPKDSPFQRGEIAPVDKDLSYRIFEANGNEYLASYLISPYTGWMFVNIVPYTSIFQKISLMKSLLFFFYVLTFLIMVYVGLRFARSITKPIENLTIKIDQVGKGRFDLDDFDVLVTRDEVGRLNRDFDRMISRLDSLIKENYVKQIMIKEAEYEALKAKINPHFLYNTLESINWLAKMNGQTQISIMVKALGDLLRNTVNNKELVTMGEEAANLAKYIQIQKFRYEERLDCRIDIPEQLFSYDIPNLILQPIVENSIQYGLERNKGICRIVVGVHILPKELIIFVSDNGPGMDAMYIDKIDDETRHSKATGIGLINIHERIRFMYGEPHGIRIDSSPGQGTTINIHIPYIQSGGA
jgi:two-component system sensor histidine kinase YesM